MDVKITVEFSPMHDAYMIITDIPDLLYTTMKSEAFHGYTQNDKPVVEFENKALSGFTFQYMLPTEKAYENNPEELAAGYCGAIVYALKAKDWPLYAIKPMVAMCRSKFMTFVESQEVKYFNSMSTLDFYKSSKISSDSKNLGFIDNLEYKFSGDYLNETKYIKQYNTYEVSLGPFSLATENDSQFSTKSQALPGMNAKVSPPCPMSVNTYCHKEQSLREAVIHLNDHHKMSREKIADWLDELHDSGVVNLEFDVETISDEEISAVAGGGEQ